MWGVCVGERTRTWSGRAGGRMRGEKALPPFHSLIALPLPQLSCPLHPCPPPQVFPAPCTRPTAGGCTAWCGGSSATCYYRLCVPPSTSRSQSRTSSRSSTTGEPVSPSHPSLSCRTAQNIESSTAVQQYTAPSADTLNLGCSFPTFTPCPRPAHVQSAPRSRLYTSHICTPLSIIRPHIFTPFHTSRQPVWSQLQSRALQDLVSERFAPMPRRSVLACLQQRELGTARVRGWGKELKDSGQGGECLKGPGGVGVGGRRQGSRPHNGGARSLYVDTSPIMPGPTSP